MPDAIITSRELTLSLPRAAKNDKVDCCCAVRLSPNCLLQLLNKGLGTMGTIVLITGGARSGKSTFAERIAKQLSAELNHCRICYIATCIPGDDEMKERLWRHRKRRPPEWGLIEEPLELSLALTEAERKSLRVVIVDCLTLWLFNLMQLRPEMFPDEEAEPFFTHVVRLLQQSREYDGAIIYVTNELGSGLVPASKWSRLFRDVAGRLNQKVAEAADFVFLTVAGLPVQLKGEKKDWGR